MSRFVRHPAAFRHRGVKYSELYQCDPLEGRIQLCEADREDTARLLVSRFSVSKEMAGRLTGQIFPLLQFNPPSGAKALLLSGPHGVGKSHLLAAISSLAERGEFADSVANRDALTLDANALAAGAMGLEAIAGRFRVLRAMPEPTAKSLRDFVLGHLGQFLAGQEVPYAFPVAPGLANLQPAFVEMMAAFHQKFPEHGLMLVVDDLSDFLATRKADDLEQDLDFLRCLGEACQNLKFRFVACIRESVFSHPRFRDAADSLHRLQPHWAEVVLETGDVPFVAIARLVRKTPEQRVLVEAHLAKFAKFYGHMLERMGEFVDLFPIHPDGLSNLGKTGLADRCGVLQLLSDAVAKRREDEVPADDPGIISYDSHWLALRDQLTGREEHETDAVLAFSRRLEEQLETPAIPAEHRHMARRLIHALAIRRLTAGDMYSGCGVTPDELRDSLCLYLPGLETVEGVPAEALLAQVKQTLEEIRESAKAPLLSVRCEDNRYDLHFRKFRRFNNPELLLHWVNAIPFLLLLLTGGIMLGSRFSHLDRQMFAWAVTLHKVCAFAWLGAMPLSVSARFKPHWANIRSFFIWGAKDAAWMIQSVRSLYNKSAAVPPAGRFNTGQKINACLVMLYYFGFGATGLLMFAKGTILFPWYVHTMLFISALGSVGGHLYLALLNPSTRIAIAGIFHGWAPMKYVEHHHALSLPESMHAHATKPVSVRSIAGEIMVSKLEITLLVITLLVGAVLVAGAGIFVFGQGRMATAKKQFAKSFADVIQPSQLTTKHRLGPTAESCTKCHQFTGEIPNQKCEQCHLDVKARRTQHLGYHGTLKGDCRLCHREHREHTAPLVPLDQAKFNHNEALFKLVGKHSEVKCDACHKDTRKPDTPGIYYLGLKHEKCADCHRDQHNGQFVAACETCHTPAGWTGANLKFHHKTGSNFPLLGLHAALDCRKCHQPPEPGLPLGSAKFKGLSRECAGCHKDPHRQQFATRCADCHTPTGWGRKDIKFAHDRDSKFPLVAKHALVACVKCHQPAQSGDPLGRAQFRGLKTECADCHQDPHRGQFARDCTKCHTTPATWKVAAPKFEHDRDTKFVLLGKHASVRCASCHKPRPENAPLASARFRELETACAKCHVVQHPDWYGSACTACHTPAAWVRKEPGFDHTRDTAFELAGKHFVAKCSACHTEKNFGVLDHAHRQAFTCLSCHQKNEPHKGALGNSCVKCHSSIGWKGEDLLFDHNSMASFGLNADHVNVACVKCHKNNVWKPLDSACSACHTKFFLDSKK